MRRLSALRLQWQLLFVLMLLVAVSGTGCKKLRANLKIKKFEKLSKDAEPYRPFSHEPVKDQAEQALKRKQDAVDAMSREDFDNALNSAIEAVEFEKQVVELARQKEAEFQFNKATDEKKVAENNEARKNAPDLYNEIVATYEAALSDLTQLKWDPLIEKSKSIILKVDQILQPLRNAATSEIKRAESIQETMVEIGAQVHAREYVNDVARLIEDANRELSDDVRRYLDARERASDAIARALEGIEETQRILSNLAIQENEALFAEANSLDAAIHTPDLWNQNNAKYEEINEIHFQRKEYQKARELSIQLAPQIKTMIMRTEQQRAAVAKDKFDEDLSKLIAEEAKQYLEDRVVEIEVLYKDATELFEKQVNPQYQANDFQKIEKMCEVGIKKIEATREAFDSFAAVEILNANSSYTVARKLFDDTENIFLLKPAEYIKKIDNEFENNKRALRKTLDSTLENILLNLNTAEGLRVQERKFHDAIQLSRSQAMRANDVRAQIYNVLAHNAINEVADQLSRWERDGGTEFAPDEVAATQQALNAAIELRDLKKYELAIEKSAEARWKLDFAIQKIERKAVDELQTAQAKIESAREQQAYRFQPEMLLQAEKLYQDAQQYLNQESLKQAVLTALECQTTAERAGERAVILWTEEEINLAVNEVQQSEQAGAAFYAGEKLDSAQDLLSTARKLSDAEKYPSARLSASQAIEEARTARFAKIDATDEILDTVRKYEGWKYDYRRLSDAIEKNQRARQLMEGEQYEAANLAADQARVIARDVLELSKVRAFQEQLAQIQRILAEVKNSGAKYYQTRRIDQLEVRIRQVKGSFNIAFFDEIMLQTHEIIKDLNDVLKNTQDIVQSQLDAHLERLAQLESKDSAIFLKAELEKAKSYLNIADVEYRKKNFLNSYSNMRLADNVIAKLENSFARDDYLNAIRTVMKDYATANQKFSHVLGIDRQTLLSFARGADGSSQFVALAGPLSPLQYREELDELYARLIRLEAPEGLSLVENEVRYIIGETRRAAANFENLLILDEFSQRRVNEIVNRAYDIMSVVREHETRLNELLLHEGDTTLKI